MTARTPGDDDRVTPPRRADAARERDTVRVVYTETGNPDGWIASDRTVDVEP